MAEKSVELPQLKDALSETTRKERRWLLGVSLLGYALTKEALRPSKISGLGIEFNLPALESLLSIVFYVVLYFLFAFLIYAVSDFLPWYISMCNELNERALEVYPSEPVYDSDPLDPDQVEFDAYKEKLQTKLRVPLGLVTPTSILRALFDFVFPVGFGAYVIYQLFKTKAGI